jgi:hypothetical protein
METTVGRGRWIAAPRSLRMECLDSPAVEDVVLAVERVLARNDALGAST